MPQSIKTLAIVLLCSLSTISFAKDGSLDTSFNSNIVGSSVIPPVIYVSLLQSDGKILIDGFFRSVDGVPRQGFARINPDGSLDSDFNLEIKNQLFSMIQQSDGKILFGSVIERDSTISTGILGRLNTDDSIDTGFNPDLGIIPSDASIRSIIQQADTKLIVAGSFIKDNAYVAGKIVRLNLDGSLDTSFNSDLIRGDIRSLVQQSDGKLVVGGFFYADDGEYRSNILRLNTDGSVDASFNFDIDGMVFSIIQQSDGRLVIGGSFLASRIQKDGILRLNLDGSLDTKFVTSTATQVLSILQQEDGRLLIGGVVYDDSFEFSNRFEFSNGIARLNTNGSFDPCFDVSLNAPAYSFMPLPNSLLLITGGFLTVNGVARANIARLENDMSPCFALTPIINLLLD